jgi:RNA polymerase sigma-70 factor (ECF subfamily)
MTARDLAEPGLGEFGAVFDRYFAEIHGYVARRLGLGVADDLAAETFETAFRKRAQFDAERGSVRAWLYGIATRHIGHHRRREARFYQALQRTSPPVAVLGPEDLVPDRVSAQAAARQLAAELARLAPGDRDVLLLVALGGLSHGEIAAALGIPYGTVGSRLNRARGKLRRALSAGVHSDAASTAPGIRWSVGAAASPAAHFGPAYRREDRERG